MLIPIQSNKQILNDK